MTTHTYTLDNLWRRIGDDGLPPLAKTIFRDGQPCARIVDVTDYVDGSSTDQPPYRYKVEYLVDGEYIDDPDDDIYDDPDVAFGASIMNLDDIDFWEHP